MLEHDNTLIKRPSHISPVKYSAPYFTGQRRVFNVETQDRGDGSKFLAV